NRFVPDAEAAEREPDGLLDELVARHSIVNNRRFRDEREHDGSRQVSSKNGTEAGKDGTAERFVRGGRGLEALLNLGHPAGEAPLEEKPSEFPVFHQAA